MLLSEKNANETYVITPPPITITLDDISHATIHNKYPFNHMTEQKKKISLFFFRKISTILTDAKHAIAIKEMQGYRG